MNITNNDFQKNLPAIQDAISKATFISIDCEMTGLKGDTIVNQFDTPLQYYEKVYANSKDFLVFQLGLCIFRYVRSDKVFKHQSYNFYLFPRPQNKNMPDVQFLCQASCIDFMMKQGFDFNKLFSQGISYLSEKDEIIAKQKVMERYNLRTKQLSVSGNVQNNTNISVPIEDKPFIDDILSKVESFIISSEKELVLPSCNGFLRRLIYQSVQNVYGHRVGLESRQLPNSTNDRTIVVTRPKSIKQLIYEEKSNLNKELQELEKLTGFSALIKFISKSGKLVVGHNMILDIMQIVDKFHNRLPKDYDNFKETLHKCFPKIVDTKYMSSTGCFTDLIKSTALNHLLGSCGSSPFTLPKIEEEKDKISYTIDSSKEHEAGYDAFITGLCLISMWNYLLGDDKKSVDYGNFENIAPYMNKLFLMRIHDEPYIRLDGPDGKLPSRDHVFHLKFPNSWKTNDIISLFNPFGNIFIAWIDSGEAYIALHKKDQAQVVLNTLSQSDTYSIMTYAAHQKFRAQNSKSPAKNKYSNTAGKKRCFEIPETNPISEISSLQMNEATDDAKLPLVKKAHNSKKLFAESNTWE